MTQIPYPKPTEGDYVLAPFLPLSLGAILAGLLAALALQVVFMMIGAGLGFAVYHPITEENPIADLGRGAIVIQGISAVFSLWFGGWIAGRFTPIGQRRTGGLHGFCVWCAATVAGVLVVSAGAGWILGDLSKLVGGGLSAAGKPVAAATGAVTEAAKEALGKSDQTQTSFVDQVVANPALTPQDKIRAKREIAFAVGRLFSPVGKVDAGANRAELVKTLVDTGAMTHAEAERTVSDWTDTYERLKADLAAAKEQAEVKAREAAEKAADALAIFSLCTAAAFLIGAAAATCGGRHGARVAVRYDTRPEPVS